MPISCSVGKNGVNLMAEVRRIQEALNIARRRDHLTLIKVDGLVGPETIGAISDFQRGHTSVVDGRIDPRGPTLRELENVIIREAESATRTALLRIFGYLERELQSRQVPVPQNVRAELVSIKSAILMLRGDSVLSDRHLAVYYPQQQRPPFHLAVAPVAVPAVAAAAAAEAAMLLLLAMLAMLIIIQAAPAMGRALEDLMRKIQIALAKILDEVKDAIKGIEDLVKRNSKAGMLCSAALILFRQLSNQLIDALTAPRPTDQLGRRRFEKQLVELFEKWQQALGELLACLTSHGAI